MLINFYSTNLAKYGKVDAENELLKEAREKHFAFSEDSIDQLDTQVLRFVAFHIPR